MSGNATYRYTDTAVLSVSVVDAPIVVTSTQMDDQLLDTYARVGLHPGMLVGLAGIRERRPGGSGHDSRFPGIERLGNKA
jgi:3-oxoacyl-[acyl-carrier-protein] synthase-3